MFTQLLFWEGSGRDQIGLQVVQSINIRVYHNIEKTALFTVNEWQTIGEEGDDASWGKAELARYYNNKYNGHEITLINSNDTLNTHSLTYYENSIC